MELLTVIALIVTIAALAVPNFTAMIKEQRVTAAVNSLQVAIMRARSYAVSTQVDHAVEFCTDPSTQKTYLRIEAESAFLESVPNLQAYVQVVDTFQAIPDTWSQAFLARRDAWGTDGKRFYSGIFNRYPTGAGSFSENYGTWGGAGAVARLYYDDRYPPKSELGSRIASWADPSRTGDRALSVEEASNVPGNHGYQDVNDSDPYSPQWGSLELIVQDNLAVDDELYLPYGVQVVLPNTPGESAEHCSTLINFDAPVNPMYNVNVCEHGWDNTYDLRFAKTGHLIQTQEVVIVLKRAEGDYLSLKMIRGTARLKKVQ